MQIIFFILIKQSEYYQCKCKETRISTYAVVVVLLLINCKLQHSSTCLRMYNQKNWLVKRVRNGSNCRVSHHHSTTKNNA